MNNNNFYSSLIRLIYLTGDLILLNTAFLIASYFKFKNITQPELDELFQPYLWLLIYYNLAWLLVSFLLNNYEIARLDGYVKVIAKMLRSVVFHFFFVAAIFFFIKTTYFSRIHLSITYGLFTFLIIFWRIFAVFLLRISRESGFNHKNFIILGYGNLGQSLLEFFNSRPELGYKFKGFFDNEVKGEGILGKMEEVQNYVLSNRISEIYCSLPDVDKKYLKELLRFADNNLIRIKIIPDLGDFSGYSLKVEAHGTIPVLLNREEPLEYFFNRIVKRAFDILFSFLVIIGLLSWLIPLIAFLIKLNSRGPVFFFQKRSGKKGREFWCIKFRTMRVNEESHSKQATEDDTRITSIGKFLRKTSLDEIPQFINVFLGDMSVVGPRPHMLAHTKYYSKLVDKYMVRHFVKPGITGLAQVKGYRGETKDIKSMIHRIRMDIFYVENWTFVLDLKIIYQTVINALKGDGNAF